MNPSEMEKTIQWFRSRVLFWLFLKFTMISITIWLFLWATAVIVGRSALGWDREPMLWGWVGLGPIVLLSVILAWRLVPGPQAVRAVIDKHGRAGGLVMAQQEAPLNGWQSRLRRNDPVRLRWRGGRWFGLFAAALTFLGVSFLVPQKYIEPAYAQRLEIGEQTEEIQKQLRVFEEENILAEQKVQEWHKQLEQIKADARGNDPVKTWESLDFIQDQLAQTAKEAAMEAMTQTQQMSQAEVLSDAMIRVNEKLDPQLSAEAMENLASLMNNAMENNENLLKSLDPTLLKELKDLPEVTLTPEQLQKLREGLQLSKKDLSEMVKKMCEAGLLDMESLKKCETAGQCDGEALAKFLMEQEGKQCDLASLVGMCSGGNVPGQGGINRGRGDAEMTWKQPTAEEGTDFKEQILPPSSMNALKESTLYGMSLGAPKTQDDASGDESTGVLGTSQAGGGSAHAGTLYPRHREAVGRYFSREED